MKQAFSRIVCLMLCALMLCSMLSNLAFAAENEIDGICGDNLTWVFNEDTGTLIISGTGEMYDYNQHATTESGDSPWMDDPPWYDYCTNIKTVIVEDGVTSLGCSAFFECSNLSNIALPESITNIGNSAFEECRNLKSITLPNSITSIGPNTFYSCSSLREINLPNGISRIEDNTFQNCSNLMDIAIPASVTSIGCCAFYNCKSLSSIIIPENVDYIGDKAFFACGSLKSITLPEGIGRIGEYAFCGCGELTWIALPASLQLIDEHAFMSCEEINHVFYGGTTISEITIYNRNNSSIETATWHCQSNSKAVQRVESCINRGFYCTVCNDYITKETVEGGKHSWDGGKVTKEPTEKETGIRTFTCTRSGCGETKTETIPVLEHTHSHTSVVTAPTCTEKGYTTYTCACGDSYTADEVPALDHKYENGTCTLCGDPDPSYNEALTRLSGSDRYDTAFSTADALKEALGVQTFDTIVVAYGRNFADALAGSYLATELDAPILLTENSAHKNVTNYIQENLSANGKVYILGGENSISAGFSDGLSAAGISWERLSGNDRYLTNLAILKEAGLNSKTILVCTGTNFADSLSASAVNLPILLVGSGLTQDQMAYLETLGNVSFKIIGGVNSVSESVADALKAYGTVDRISGDTREATSKLVADTFCPDSATVALAYSRNFPDGLCGGPLAYQLGAPLLLVNSGAESFAADYVAENEITSGIILGGTASVSDETVANIFPQ